MKYSNYVILVSYDSLNFFSESGAAICTFYMKTVCNKGTACPFRHVKGDRTVVCKHWLRGLCKKGDDCEFLHEYDMTKMPECYFFSKFGEYTGKHEKYYGFGMHEITSTSIYSFVLSWPRWLIRIDWGL